MKFEAINPFGVWQSRWTGDRPPLIGDRFMIDPQDFSARHAREGETPTNTVENVSYERYGDLLSGAGNDTVIYTVHWRVRNA